LLVVAYFLYKGEGTLSKQSKKKTTKDKHTKVILLVLILWMSAELLNVLIDRCST